jgi:hypothetical protein
MRKLTASHNLNETELEQLLQHLLVFMEMRDIKIVETDTSISDGYRWNVYWSEESE